MKIIICCATPWELKSIKDAIKSLGLKINLDLHYLCTGIGNYATIASLSDYLTEQRIKHPDQEFFLLNIGVCGYMSEKEPPSCIQIGRIKNLHTNKELLPPLSLQIAPIASIFCSEVVLKKRNLAQEEGFVDMESRAIEYLADKRRLPRLLLKVPIDKVGEETENFDRTQACQKLTSAIDYRQLLLTIFELSNQKK